MLSNRGLVLFRRIVDSIALATRWVFGRSLAHSAYKTKSRLRRTCAGGRLASSAEGGLGAVLKTPSIHLAALFYSISSAVVLLLGFY